MNATDFVDQLRAAFPPEPIRGDGAFAQWGSTYSDVELYTRAVDGKTWEQVDPNVLLTNTDALGFLGTRHLVAVLPVYLRSVVEQGVMSPAAEMLPIILARPAPGASTGLGHARFDALVDALTAAQRTVIAAALRGLAADSGSPGRAARAALDSYWKMREQHQAAFDASPEELAAAALAQSRHARRR
jgi:hypothetical protein